MIEGDIQQDQQFRHIRTGVNYTVLLCSHENEKTLAKFSDAPHGEGWEGAIVFYDEFQQGVSFVVSEEHFRRSFEREE